MGTLPTTIPPLSATDYANRMAALFPPGWSSPEAKSPGGVLYAVMGMIGGGLSFENGGLIYSLAATRIQTAINGALDLASLDYFGSGLYAVPRNPGESDASYRVRLTAAMLQPRATRAAISAAVEAVTGYAPRIIEPWRPADTGAWGHFYWDVDNARTPFRWTGSAIPAQRNLAYQGFLECVLPTPALLNGNPVPCYDSIFFWDSPGSSLIDLEPSVTLGPQVVYNAINQTKCEGTIAWVKFVPAPAPSWDSGQNWDQAGLSWS
jgi:hypothetical protein